jgi:hypothetical protein
MADKPSLRPLIAAIRKQLPKPVRKVVEADGSTVFIAGDPGEVIVRVSDSSLTVFEFAVEWIGPHQHEFREVPVARLEWPELPRARAIDAIAALIAATRASRLAKYRKCRFCGETSPPEWMTKKDVCDGCAEAHLGIIH